MRHLIGLAAVLGLGGSALAADLSVKAPAVGYGNWTGCYIGGNVTGGWDRFETNDVVAFTGAPVNPLGSVRIDGDHGLMYGGQVGCDYQWAGPWVVGIEGTFLNGPITGDNTLDFPFLTYKQDTKVPWLATVTGRIGYATDPRTMMYIKGGAAFTKDDMRISLFTTPGQIQPLFFSSENRVGWDIGLGLEHKWWPNVSGTIEYNYIDLGSRGVGFTTIGGAPAGTLNFKGQIQTFTLGLNFHLFGAGLVAAKY